MTTLSPSSLATSSTATEGNVKDFLTNLRDFLADSLGTDSANKGAIQGLLQNILHGRVSKSAAYTVLDSDRGKVIDCTGSWTLNIAAAATLGDGFTFAVRNSGGGAIVIDPNLTEQIQSANSYTLGSGEFVIIYCDGTGFSFVGGGSMPSGTIAPYAGANAPAGWLLCYGQAVSRTTYSGLFAAIGTTYGTGDGSTTFNLPDLRGRAPVGKDNMGGTAANRMTSAGSGVNGTTLGASGGSQTHTLTTAQMPAHTHNITPGPYAFGYTNPSYNTSDGMAGGSATTSAGSGQAHNNTQPSIILNMVIKT